MCGTEFVLPLTYITIGTPAHCPFFASGHGFNNRTLVVQAYLVQGLVLTKKRDSCRSSTALKPKCVFLFASAHVYIYTYIYAGIDR